MADKLPILTQVNFFQSSFCPSTAKVSPRPFSSLTYRKSGKVSIFTTDTSFVSLPNTVTFIPAGCAYETEILEAGEMLILHYTTGEPHVDFGDTPMTIAPAHAEILLNLFLRGVRHCQSEGCRYACMADAYRILAEAEPLFFQKDLLPYKKMTDCKQYLDEHLFESDLRVCDLAARFGTSEVWFRKEFQRFYHCSPMEYIKTRRLEHACQLLRTKLYSVAEVATRSGFDSISYFSAQFHRHFGISPRAYRDL